MNKHITKQIKTIAENPLLIAEWDKAKNSQIGLFPDLVTEGSNKTAWWICNKGHSWKAIIYNRSKGKGCPYCSGHLAIIGENDLLTISPQLCSEWDYKKNANLRPENFKPSSGKSVWWICQYGHSWRGRIQHRYNGSGCPYCSGRLAIPGKTDLSTIFPGIAKEWDYLKNSPLTPIDVKPKSKKAVWWKCNLGHEYLSTISERTRGNGCPYCSNCKVLKGYNDLETIMPSLAKEWDYKKNKLYPNEVLPKSGKKVYWICPAGHNYSARIASRTNGGGCPICVNQKLMIGFNDLATCRPDIAKEWDFSKNTDLTPEMIVLGSTKKVFWRCRKGHAWESSVIYRTRYGHNCPICNRAKTTSFPEKAILFYVRRIFPNTRENYYTPELQGKELDIFIEDYKIAIEYDGDYWHKNILNDIKKNDLCQKAGITLIRIREPDCPVIQGTSINFQMTSHSQESYYNSINFVLNQLKILTGISFSIEVSLENDMSAIMDLIEHDEIKKSLAQSNPSLASEWHPTKNGNITPYQVSPNSSKKVWWKGECGHEWFSAISSRNRGCGCPICRGLSVLPGFNDLASQYSQIAEEWDIEKNTGLLPTSVPSKSNRKVWWKCNLGHEYLSTISDRTRGNGCPYCSNRQVLKGFNDLESKYPDLSKEWSDKNNLLPCEVTAKSGKKVWWKCKICGQEWKSIIANRSKGCGCPVCSNRTIVKGYNDLKSTNPDLINEWSKRNKLSPCQVTAGSGKKVWWKCKICGKEWEATVNNRTKGTGCPFCFNRKRHQNNIANV